VNGSIVDLTMGLALLSTIASLAVPHASAAVDANRARQAAEYAASQFRLARQQAVARSSSTGLVFDFLNGRWTYRVCTDGNANGVRRTDIGSGRDACPGATVDLEAMFPGIQVAVDSTLRGPDGDAPSPDPVRFGSSDLASFSPAGTCTAGSLFLRSAKGAQFVVRMSGVTGRLRIMRYDEGARAWKEA
jgi:Tfp pilus assembly protein FimT